jgi:filamentous hemagglutinin family protein
MVTRVIRTLLLSGVVLSRALPAVSQAPFTSAITADGTLGTAVRQAGNVYNIHGGTIRGSNLFHSFDRFSVGTGDIASFNGVGGIANILSRVTGGQPSAIDGTVRSTIPGANLFLLNPSGVLFGPNASLEVSGAVHVSTADFLRFADGAKFFATPGQESVLTVASPAAFGFLSGNPAGISIQESRLQVPAGKTLSVVGGDVEMRGGVLQAPSGRLQLASVASPGEVIFSPLELAPELQVDSFTRLGRLELSQGTLADASGVGNPGSGGPGGTVLIRSGRLIVDRSNIFAQTLGDQAGNPLAIDLRVSDDISLTNAAQIRASSRGAGDGGDVFVETGRLSISAGSAIGFTGIFTSNFGTGRGGKLTVKATESISIAGRDPAGNQSGLFANSFSSGHGSGISVSTPTLKVEDGAHIESGALGEGNAGNMDLSIGRLILNGGGQIDTSTFGSGRGGNMKAIVTDSISIAGSDRLGFRSGLFSTSNAGGDAGSLFVSTPNLSIDGGSIVARTLGEGNAGNTDVRVEKLTLIGGGQIFSGTGHFGFVNGVPTHTGIDGPGRGGDLTVVATDSISIAGRDKDGIKSGLFSLAQFGRGRGGNLSIITPTLNMDDSFVLSGSVGRSRGDGGNLVLEVGKLILTGGAQISSHTEGVGRAGNLAVAARESISIAGRNREGFRSGLFSITDASGDAGDLSVSTPILSIDGGSIVARTLGVGNAGKIDVRAGKVTLTGGGQLFNGTGTLEIVDGVPTPGGIDGSGRGGDLTVTATDSISIVGRDKDGIKSGFFSTAQFGRGKGGNVFVSTPILRMDDGGVITADTLSSSSGDAGNIDLRANSSTLTRSAEISSSTFGVGRGGNVRVSGKSIELADGAAISAKSSGTGNAGDIHITAEDKLVSRNSSVTTEARQSDGGNIDIRAGSLFHLSRSEITTSVSTGEGRGGNITIDPQFVILDRSQIRADAFGGPGGNVRIAAEVFLASPDSVVSASSARGITGTVDIRAPITSLSGVLAPLPAAFVSAAALLPARCAVRLSEGKASSLVVGGRDGLPFDPGGLLPSPLTLDERLMSVPTVTEEPQRQKPTTSFALLADEDKVFPRMQGWDWQGSAWAALDWRCSR